MAGVPGPGGPPGGNVVGFPGGAPTGPRPAMPAGPIPGAMVPALPPPRPMGPGPQPAGPPPAAGPMPGPPAPPGPMPPAPAAPPGMMVNPAYQQWQQLSQAWHAENTRRRTQFQAACAVLRDDVATGYKIDIEADSTVAPDELEEKQARTEFLQSILPMLQLLIPEAQANPGAVPLIHALVMFGVRAFPAARSLEDTFEQAFAQLFKSPPPPPEQKGNVKSPMEIQSEEKIAAGEQQVDQQKNQVAAAQVQVAQQKNAIQMFQTWLQAQNEQRGQNQDAQLRTAELAQQGQEMQSRQALEQARLTHLVTRDSGGLV